MMFNHTSGGSTGKSFVVAVIFETVKIMIDFKAEFEKAEGERDEEAQLREVKWKETRIYNESVGKETTLIKAWI